MVSDAIGVYWIDINRNTVTTVYDVFDSDTDREPVSVSVQYANYDDNFFIVPVCIIHVVANAKFVGHLFSNFDIYDDSNAHIKSSSNVFAATYWYTVHVNRIDFLSYSIPNSLSWAHTYGHTDPDLYCDLNVVSDTKFVADIYIYPFCKSSLDG